VAKDEKARIYQRIVSGTPESFLLERMRVHGFWAHGEGLPPDPPDQAEERAALEKKAADLKQQYSIVKDPEKALAEEKKRRWEESKKRRAEKKAQREAEAKARREAWEETRSRTITHLGEGVSAGLQDVESDRPKLEAAGLPVLNTGVELANAIGITIGRLRWLTFHRRGAVKVHYHRYEIAKKTGGVRQISAPKPHLSSAQHWVQENILSKVAIEAESHGFVPGRSILTNAGPHTRKQIVVNMDLKDFFPSITFRRVKGMFHKVGYSEQVSTILALLCTEPPRVLAEIPNGKRYYVALGERVLPQGACTSPSITNIICRRLDKRLRGLAEKLGYAYTRYADDLTFSGSDKSKVGLLIKSIRSIITDEGFTEHPTKTCVMHRGRRQEVTGLTVNDKCTLNRKERRRLKAILHNAAKHGLESQNRNNHPYFAEYLRGKVAYACMVEPHRAGWWRQMLGEAIREDIPPEPKPKPENVREPQRTVRKPETTQRSTDSESPSKSKKWWQFWVRD
jgi:retron-type reverse transcriptase